MHRIMIALIIVSSLPAGERLRIPIDVAQQEQLASSLKAAVEEGNVQTVLRQGRRTLEMYPNDPRIQASIYLLMAEASRKAENEAQAGLFEGIANSIDPALSKRLALGGTSVVTRGDKADKFNIALAMVSQGLQSYSQIRMQVQQQRLEAQIRALQAQQTAAGASQVQNPAVAYPPIPVGGPNYQPNPAMNGPMPGWVPAPPAPPTANQPGGGGGGPFSSPEYNAPAPTPYNVPTYAPVPAVNRGVKATLFKVIHDHSQIGDAAYFERACGALLFVSGSNLTVTPSGGEAPLVIPVQDIVEIRVNNAIGKEFGIFHIATRQGLYLSLAPDSPSPEEGRRLVGELRSGLGVSER